MTSLIRIGVSKASLIAPRSLLVKINYQSTRTITSRLDELPPKPKPWPYNEKPYTNLQYFFDKTTPRFDENTKLIIVEGPVASGKSKLAKEIAKSFGMLYYPEANLDMQYINPYGYDLRQLDSMLPPSCKSFDVMDFMRNPNHMLVARWQIEQYMIKVSQYIDSLAHLLSTGQGVVLDRCAFSDFVFVEAMYSQKYLSKPAYKKYYEFRRSTIDHLLKPHLIIYLDVPVSKVLENVRQRNISYEKNSPVFTQQYLEVMEKTYKQKYLKEMSPNAELLVYDWTVEGDTDIVVEDVEAIDFDKYDEQDSHFQDWNLPNEEEWGCVRSRYADQKDDILSYANVQTYDVPELLMSGEDSQIYCRVMDEAPGQQYEFGYNKSMGDGGFLFKWDRPTRSTLPLRERRTV
uniref:NADH dehydrogenase [ubiquinone] 1 alpha subcomplex subunit 10, mitochondrial n=1 Tax=Dendroctonus ponderosae TaxID=77166 RepID=J3JVZ9_DENPD|nr:unknown [Dendroctonus ponderosae]